MLHEDIPLPSAHNCFIGKWVPSIPPVFTVHSHWHYVVFAEISDAMRNHYFILPPIKDIPSIGHTYRKYKTYNIILSVRVPLIHT